MGWIAAVGAIVITFFLFFRSSRSFSSMFKFNLFSRLTTTTTTTTTTNTQTPLDTRPSESKKEGQDLVAQNGRRSSEEIISEEVDAEENPDSQQTTPKASTAAAAPVLPVPALSLNHPESGQSEQSTATSSDEGASRILSSQSPVSSSQTTSSSANTSSSLMPPPPPRLSALPQQQQQQQQQRQSTQSSSSGQLLAPPKLKPVAPLRPPPSAAAALRGRPSPQTTTTAGGLTTSTLAPSQRTSRKVILEPGHSPLDWAALASNPKNNLRGAGLPANLIRVTPSMLKAHHGRKGVDAWTSYNGKVYNITPYLPFHPGGKGELMRGAGKGSDKLFLEIHPWVNWEGILGECLVGILVSENEAGVNKLDEMD